MIHVKLFKQSPGFCGPTSLRMVLDYYGMERSEEELAELVRATPENGCDPEDLVMGAKSLGFVAVFLKNMARESAVRQLEESVNKEKIPVIVNWLPSIGDHYSVITDVGRGLIAYADPYYGKEKIISKDEFVERWAGYYRLPPSGKSDVFLRGMVLVKPNGTDF